MMSDRMPMPLPRVTFVLATLNEAHRLAACLSSIRQQSYPQALVDILIADGGSTDGTEAIAQQFDAHVFANPMVRCEPGIAMLIDKVRDGLIVVFAADNILVGSLWLRRMVSAFSADEVVAAFCPLAYGADQGTLANRYLARFSDPFNHFVYWNGADYPNLARSYPRFYLGEKDGAAHFRFSREHFPLVAFAQGVTIRAPYARAAGLEEDDVGPLLDLASGRVVALVPDIAVSHFTVSGLGGFAKKFSPRIRQKMLPGSTLLARPVALTPSRAVRRALWPAYACSVLAPALTGLFMAVRTREPLWCYHPVISLVMALCLLRELVRGAPELISAWLAAMTQKRIA